MKLELFKRCTLCEWSTNKMLEKHECPKKKEVIKMIDKKKKKTSIKQPGFTDSKKSTTNRKKMLKRLKKQKNKESLKEIQWQLLGKAVSHLDTPESALIILEREMNHLILKSGVDDKTQYECCICKMIIIGTDEYAEHIEESNDHDCLKCQNIFRMILCLNESKNKK